MAPRVVIVSGGLAISPSGVDAVDEMLGVGIWVGAAGSSFRLAVAAREMLTASALGCPDNPFRAAPTVAR